MFLLFRKKRAENYEMAQLATFRVPSKNKGQKKALGYFHQLRGFSRSEYSKSELNRHEKCSGDKINSRKQGRTARKPFSEHYCKLGRS